MDQIYTVTTDNGANMLKAVKMLSSDYGNSDGAIVEENKRANVDDDIDLDLQLDLDQLTEESEENKPEDHTENILRDIENSTLGSDFSSSILTGVRCAAHTLQLAVDDALKNVNKGILSLIKKVRRVVKKLRTQTILYMLKKQNLKKPIIDCPTRWCSTVIMLERLLLLKNYCTELAVTKFENFETLTDAEWAKIEEVCRTLQPLKTCTEKLQAEQLTLSDFFSNWLETKLEIKKMNTPFAILIFEFMVSREKHLLENNVLLSALFLDPRFKILLEETQIEKAKTHLKHLWAKMMSLQGNLITSNSDSQECPSSGSESTSDDFESFLKLKEIHHNSGISRSSSSSSVQLHEHLSLRRIEILLDGYNQEQRRISRKTNILEFWKEKSMIQPELYKLAMVVLAVPATQVSVERLFSGLKFILSPLRTNIDEAILEDQLLVRANRIFIKKDNTQV
ncbi:Zinc finger BED domain-containing protein 4 [Camponotus floridanus]|uniref:Zinc finger BED domain-containing protein 4 n=1 Tax=Camponotus floridanus TaxID=104421 RepID=E2ACL7_CAMFO|nr:Zinc finger BED domain-containing protein 4 [Camponotus floridanus]